MHQRPLPAMFRWAMLAAAGAIAPEALAHIFVIPQQTGLPWFEAGGLFSRSSGGHLPGHLQ